MCWGNEKSWGDKICIGNGCKCFECSCANGVNVIEVFKEMAFDAYQMFDEDNSGGLSFPVGNEEKENGGENNGGKSDSGNHKNKNDGGGKVVVEGASGGGCSCWKNWSKKKFERGLALVHSDWKEVDFI